MMKKFSICLLTLSLCLVARAQWSVGIMAGYDYNSYSMAKGYAYDYRYGGMGGFIIFTIVLAAWRLLRLVFGAWCRASILSWPMAK